MLDTNAGLLGVSICVLHPFEPVILYTGLLGLSNVYCIPLSLSYFKQFCWYVHSVRK